MPKRSICRRIAGCPGRRTRRAARGGIGGAVSLRLCDHGRRFSLAVLALHRIYTPRHIYGFNNVEMGRIRHGGPKVIENYDHWAENLTPGLAVKNVACGRWQRHNGPWGRSPY